MGKKKKDPEPESEPEYFHVEVITKARVAPMTSDEEIDEEDEALDQVGSSKGKAKAKLKKKKKKESARWEYYVKWGGYDSDANSWEPETNLASCQRLLQSFWQEIGTDDYDYPVGYEVTASEKWIKKEREFFAREFSQKKRRERKEREDREERERIKRINKKKKVDTSPKPSTSTSLKIKLPAKRKQTLFLDSDDDDIPLSQKISKKRLNDTIHVSSAQNKATKMTKEPSPLPSEQSMDKSWAELLFQEPESPPSNPKPTSTAPPLPSRPKTLPTPVATSTPSVPSSSKPPALPRRSFYPIQKKVAMRPSSVITSSTGISTKQRIAQGALVPTNPKAVVRKDSTTDAEKSKSKPSLISLGFKKSTTSILPSPISGPSFVASPVSDVTTPRSPTVSAIEGSSTSPIPPSLIGKSSLSSTHVQSPLASSFTVPEPPTQQLLSVDHPPAQKQLPTLSMPQSQEMRQPEPQGQDATLTSLDSTTIEPEPPLLFDDDQSTSFSTDISSAFARFTDNQPDQMTISPHMLHAPASSSLMDQANNFLRSIMPPSLAAPLAPAPEEALEPVPTRTSVSKPALPQRIPKKWKWTGPLFIDQSPEPKRLCDVVMGDTTDPFQMSMKFNVVFAPMKELEFISFHDAIDMSAFLAACKPPQQLALLSSSTDAESSNDISVSSDLFHVLVRYMAQKQQVVLSPLSLDDRIVAHVLFFPYAIRDLVERFNVPAHMYRPNTLIAALIPWAVPSSVLSMEEYRKPPSLYLPSDAGKTESLFPKDQAKWEMVIRTKPKYYHALWILQFPRTLHAFFSEESRSYSIWWEGGDEALASSTSTPNSALPLLSSRGSGSSSKVEPGMETNLLITLLEQTGAKLTMSDSRVFFVHVGALRTLHRFSHLAERRSKPSPVQFFTYGTHESIAPEHWGVHEIFTIGGVVTFTPRAIVDDPWGTLKRIEQVSEHPVWECYIIPSVLGIVAKMHAQDEDPLALYDNGQFVYDSLLNAIDQGQIALMTAPPVTRTPPAPEHRQHYKDPRDNEDWICETLLRRPMTPRDALRLGLDAFNARYANKHQVEWAAEIEQEMSADFLALQRHVGIVKQFRRFVVVRSERDEDMPKLRDGLEYTTTNKFDFRDDYFSDSS